MSDVTPPRVTTRSQRIRADLMLLGIALIWGVAFVAQRLGMDQIGPFMFNAVRFILASVVMVPIVGRRHLQGLTGADWRDGALLGVLLFGGASMQQLGLVYTTAGKAGFITGMYVVLVPLALAIFWCERTSRWNWIAAMVAVLGMFLLSVESDFRLKLGDTFVLIGAFLWTSHVIAVDRITPGREVLRLAIVQYVVCGALSLVLSLLIERATWGGIWRAGPAILYVALLSTCLGYTGQLIAQRRTAPAHAAIIFSMESVFAALAGWLMLGELLTPRQFVGCCLMLAGMLMAQLSRLR